MEPNLAQIEPWREPGGALAGAARMEPDGALEGAKIYKMEPKMETFWSTLESQHLYWELQENGAKWSELKKTRNGLSNLEISSGGRPRMAPILEGGSATPRHVRFKENPKIPLLGKKTKHKQPQSFVTFRFFRA